MNTVRTINTDYLRSSRTVETLLVSNANSERVFFVYNYEGYSFRLFKSHLSLMKCFQDNESDFHFETEKELDLFLSNIDLRKIKVNVE